MSPVRGPASWTLQSFFIPLLAEYHSVLLHQGKKSLIFLSGLDSEQFFSEEVAMLPDWGSGRSFSEEMAILVDWELGRMGRYEPSPEIRSALTFREEILLES